MKFLQHTKWAGPLIITLVLGSGCATAPTEEVATAEEAVEEAAEVVETPDSSVEVAGAEAETAQAESVDLSQPEAEMAAAVTYTVVTGDNLWAISAKDEIYGNPYQWPLIYKANRDQIEDADLIYPGQDFNISKNPSMDVVDAAVQHAKTRGAWIVGETEASDLEYLNR